MPHSSSKMYTLRLTLPSAPSDAYCLSPPSRSTQAMLEPFKAVGGQVPQVWFRISDVCHAHVAREGVHPCPVNSWLVHQELFSRPLLFWPTECLNPMRPGSGCHRGCGFTCGKLAKQLNAVAVQSPTPLSPNIGEHSLLSAPPSWARPREPPLDLLPRSS